MASVAFDEGLRTDIASCSAILGTLFLCKPESKEARAVIDALCEAPTGDWPFGSEDDLAASAVLLKAICGDPGSFEQSLSKDYQKLFVGPFSLAAPPWGSVYLDYESVICGCSTLALQEWMRANGLVISRDHNEPEDHVGLMFMLLSWLAVNRPELISEYMEAHFCTWVPHFCDLMEEKAETPFYQGVAMLARTTLLAISDELGLQIVEPRFYR